MVDGGFESGRDSEFQYAKEGASAGTDDFGRAVSRIAVAHLCESAGFESTQLSALDALSDLAIRFISDLGKTARFYANLSSRTSCNVFDIIRGLEDFDGSSGDTDLRQCFARPGFFSEVARYVAVAEDVPFPQIIPHFPIVSQNRLNPTFAEIGDTPPAKHIPDWLPALPDPHTYIHTPIWNKRMPDPKAEKIEQAKQRRKAEQSLLSLQQRLAGNSARARIPVGVGSSGKGKHVAVDVNTFLAPSEKEMTTLILTDETSAKKKIPVLETFMPVIEALKNDALGTEENEKEVFPNNRPLVHFKFGIEKKTLDTPLTLGIPGSRISNSWSSGGDERDDKKRRVQLIIRESIDNPQELHQL